METKNLELKKESVWRQIDENENNLIFEYGEKYKNFLDSGKTERLAAKFFIENAKKCGFISLEDALSGKIKAGDKIFYNNKGKSVILYIIGSDDIENGLNIVGAHIDSPRLDLKPNPLYEDSELAMFKTHYYGGIKKYQWTTIPLSLIGTVFTKDGRKVDISIGENEDDPVFYINDLLIHLSQTQNKKTLGDAVEGESLNLVVGHSSFEFKNDDNPIKLSVLKYLYDNYNIKEEDFVTAELEAVPNAKARDVGFDRAMIAAHGHDDRVCAFAAFSAISEIENPKKTAAILLVDKEEIGSIGNTSMTSKAFENSLAEIINNMGNYSELTLRRALANSKILSADVTAAVDPYYKDVMDPLNAAMSGFGITISKYGGARGKSGSNDANPEFIAELLALFDRENVIYQTGELGKVDQGGGGTISGFLAEYGAEVLDIGTAMLSMHAPVELVSKADAYMTYKAYKAFIK